MAMASLPVAEAIPGAPGAPSAPFVPLMPMLELPVVEMFCTAEVKLATWLFVANNWLPVTASVLPAANEPSVKPESFVVPPLVEPGVAPGKGENMVEEAGIESRLPGIVSDVPFPVLVQNIGIWINHCD